MFKVFMAVLKQSNQMSETSVAHKNSNLMECDVKSFTKYIKLPLRQQCEPQVHIF